MICNYFDQLCQYRQDAVEKFEDALEMEHVDYLSMQIDREKSGLVRVCFSPVQGRFVYDMDLSYVLKDPGPPVFADAQLLYATWV